jgi:hypothetical protein
MVSHAYQGFSSSAVGWIKLKDGSEEAASTLWSRQEDEG